MLRVFDRAMSPSTMPFGPELTAEGLRTLRFSKGSVEWRTCFPDHRNKQRNRGSIIDSYQERLLEFCSIEAGLPYDRLQSADPDFIVIGNGDGDSARGQVFLHDNMASAPAYLLETMSRQN